MVGKDQAGDCCGSTHPLCSLRLQLFRQARLVRKIRCGSTVHGCHFYVYTSSTSRPPSDGRQRRKELGLGVIYFSSRLYLPMPWPCLTRPSMLPPHRITKWIAASR